MTQPWYALANDTEAASPALLVYRPRGRAAPANHGLIRCRPGRLTTSCRSITRQRHAQKFHSAADDGRPDCLLLEPVAIDQRETRAPLHAALVERDVESVPDRACRRVDGMFSSLAARFDPDPQAWQPSLGARGMPLDHREPGPIGS